MSYKFTDPAFEHFLEAIKADKTNVPFDKYEEELVKTVADYNALRMLVEGRKKNRLRFIENNSFDNFENVIDAHNQKVKIEMDEEELKNIEELIEFLKAIVELK